MPVSIERAQSWISGNIGVSVGLTYVFLTFFLPYKTPALSARPTFNIGVLMLVGIASAMLGWGLGIFLSPIGPQVKSASILASAFTSFWTGVVVSHIEVISRTFMDTAHHGLGQAAKVRLLFGGGVFLMSLLVTVNSRFPSGNPPPPDDQTPAPAAAQPK
jgi:hypothetical protein